jgi:hypothetical protein
LVTYAGKESDMKLSRLLFQYKEKITVKRALLVVAAALMFLSTLATPTIARADGDPANGCGGAICKP